MAKRRNQRTYPYRPDYATPPGWLLRDYLETWDFTPAEFARRHSLGIELVEGILAGNAPLDPELAAVLEQEFDLAASVWLGMENQYRRRLAEIARAAAMSGFADWAKAFPIRELVKRSVIEKPTSDGDAVVKMLDFFGVASVAEWQCRNDASKVAYRRSPSFASNERNLAVWLRLGEMESEWQQCPDYDAEEFRGALREIRALTRTPTGQALEKTFALCNQSGVALALVEPLPKVAVSGATRWLSHSAPLIQLSVRHKTNDHLWFTLFHEAAHVLLHSKDYVFIDTDQDQIAGFDAEADEWASDFLIARSDWNDFVSDGHFNEWAVRSFANRQGIAPAIVVGRLQRERLVPWSWLNHLKARMRWRE